MMNKELLQKLVTRLRTDCYEAHRGAFCWDEGRGVAVAFGNDGTPPDEPVDFEIAAIRGLLRRYGGKELAFAVEPEGGTWAMACDLSGSSLNEDVLEAVLWEAWNAKAEGNDFEPESVTMDEGRLTSGTFKDNYTGWQVKIARSILERNGLV
jgi:hypothetical protein